MKSKAGLFLVILMIVGLVSYAIYLTTSEPEKAVVVGFNRDKDGFDGDEESGDVIEKTVVVRNVYVSEDDFSGYADSEETTSYWYVNFFCKDKTSEEPAQWDGYGIFTMPTKHFNVKEAKKQAWAEATDKDYIQIQFFKRVSFETYKAGI